MGASETLSSFSYKTIEDTVLFNYSTHHILPLALNVRTEHPFLLATDMTLHKSRRKLSIREVIW